LTDRVADSLPIVVPVRFSGGGLTMQTTSSRLGADSIFVRGVVTPKEGSSITIRITLPDAPEPLDARATVIERVMPNVKGKEAGFWARFDALTPEATAQLEKLLRERSGQGGPTRRAFARVPVKLEVEWTSAREFLVVYAENISAGGMFVVSQDPPPLHEVVELSLKLPDGDPPAKTQAEVIQRLTADEARRLGRQPGAGLQFVGGDDDFRRRLDRCIENLLVQPEH
jgi:uncharacterized protein (TIGR02266 family)